MQKYPLIIISRNRFSLVKNAVEFALRQKLEVFPIVMDMDSTYPPLIDYLSYIEGKGIQVVRLENLGPRKLWASIEFKKIAEAGPFFLTDGDIDFDSTSDDCCDELVRISKKFSGFNKVGSALKISDLDRNDTKQRLVWLSEIGNWDSRRKISENIYLAPTDATFAFYPRFSKDFHFWPALRISGKCEVRHAPWYEDSNNRSAEELFYSETAMWWGVDGVTSAEKQG